MWRKKLQTIYMSQIVRLVCESWRMVLENKITRLETPMKSSKRSPTQVPKLWNEWLWESRSRRLNLLIQFLGVQFWSALLRINFCFSSKRGVVFFPFFLFLEKNSQKNSQKNSSEMKPKNQISNIGYYRLNLFPYSNQLLTLWSKPFGRPCRYFWFNSITTSSKLNGLKLEITFPFFFFSILTSSCYFHPTHQYYRM